MPKIEWMSLGGCESFQNFTNDFGWSIRFQFFFSSFEQIVYYVRENTAGNSDRHGWNNFQWKCWSIGIHANMENWDDSIDWYLCGHLANTYQQKVNPMWHNMVYCLSFCFCVCVCVFACCSQRNHSFWWYSMFTDP